MVLTRLGPFKGRGSQSVSETKMTEAQTKKKDTTWPASYKVRKIAIF